MQGRNQDPTKSRGSHGGATDADGREQSDRRESAGGQSRSQRAQTTLDFAIGVSVFLAVMLFTFTFVPGILEPFELTGDQDIILSERISSQLSTDFLSDPEHPNILDRYCAVEFFSTGAPPECSYSESVPRDRLALESWQSFNISLEGGPDGSVGEILCWSRDEEDFVDDCTTGDTQRLTVGDPVPSNSEATITSRRTVSLNRETVQLKVVLW